MPPKYFSLLCICCLLFCPGSVKGQSAQCDNNAPYNCSFEDKDKENDSKTYCNWCLSDVGYWDGAGCHNDDGGCVAISSTNRDGALTSSLAFPTNNGGSSQSPLCLTFWYFFEVTYTGMGNAFTGYINVTVDAMGTTSNPTAQILHEVIPQTNKNAWTPVSEPYEI